MRTVGPSHRPSRSVPDRRGRIRFAAASIATALACLAWPVVAAVANRHWYAGLLKPFFAPAPWLAGLLLAAVSAAAGGALFRILCRPDYHPDRGPALRAFAVGLAAAAAWVWAFFVGRHPTLSLGLAVVLVGASVWTLRQTAKVERRAALLLVPWALGAALVALVDLSVRLRNG